VLVNLLDNAVKFSPQGGTITVAARGRSSVAEITVSDEGIGISAPERPRVFSKFFRSERGPVGEGTGLGLFLVRGLVSAMGGRIWVESAEGRGSQFTFELPLAGAERAPSAPVEASAP
jgi:signal transduction histidine kinase